ncbi:hypothetical protein PCE1_000240 [Barthelona sp. PCE]
MRRRPLIPLDLIPGIDADITAILTPRSRRMNSRASSRSSRAGSFVFASHLLPRPRGADQISGLRNFEIQKFIEQSHRVDETLKMVLEILESTEMALSMEQLYDLLLNEDKDFNLHYSDLLEVLKSNSSYVASDCTPILMIETFSEDAEPYVLYMRNVIESEDHEELVEQDFENEEELENVEENEEEDVDETEGETALIQIENEEDEEDDEQANYSDDTYVFVEDMFSDNEEDDLHFYVEEVDSDESLKNEEAEYEDIAKNKQCDLL